MKFRTAPVPSRLSGWLPVAMLGCLLAFTTNARTQDLPSLDQLFAPAPATSTPTPTPTPVPPAQPLLETVPGLEPIISGQPLTTPVPNNGDVNASPEVQNAVDRQARRRKVDEVLGQIRENFAQGDFNKVLDLVKQAEAVEPENPNVKFYKDWATKKIRTGEGPRGAVINNPRLAGTLSTPDPSIPTPRTARTSRPAPTATPALPVATPAVALATPATANPTPTTAPPQVPVTAAPIVVATSGGFLSDYGPILAAVAVGLLILGIAAYLISRRTPIPTAPKIQYQPVPILPNILASGPVDAFSATATQRDLNTNQDPQTLAVEEDEPPMAMPPQMANFASPPPGLFGQVGQGLATSGMAPMQPMQPTALPAMDVLPTVNEGHDDTMYAIEEDPEEGLPDPLEGVLEATAYDFYEARTQEVGFNDQESTQITPGPLPPSALHPLGQFDVDHTLPLTGPLPPSRFEFPAPAAEPLPPAPAAVQPPATPAPALSLETFSFDPDVTVPVATSLPPSKFDLPPSSAPLPPSPPAPTATPFRPAEAEDVMATPLLDLPMPEPSEPALPKQLLGVFPGKAKPAAEAPAPKANTPETVPTPTLPPASPANDGMIDLAALGISLTPSTPKPTAQPAPPPPAAPAPAAPPAPSVFDGLDKITLAPEPEPHPDDHLAATSDMSPYKSDAGLSATKTQAHFDVGSDSIYGNPSLSEAEQSAEMVRQEVARGDRAAAAGDWKKAVHYYAIAASIQNDHPELMEKLRQAREKKREAEGQ